MRTPLLNMILVAMLALPWLMQALFEPVPLSTSTHSKALPSCSGPHGGNHTCRICVCFFGLVRHYDMVAQSVQRHIFDVIEAANYTFDIYAHTYRINSVYNKRNGELGISVDPESLQRLLPQAEIIYDYTEAADSSMDISHLLMNGDPWPDNPGTSVKFFVRQLYSLHRVSQLWKHRMKEYDYCVYLRPDVMFISDLDLFQNQRQLNDTFVGTPNWHKWGGLNDRFAYGVPNAMQLFGTRFNLLPYYVMVYHKAPHAEKFLKFFFRKKRLNKVWSYTMFQRLRADGRVDARDKGMITKSLSYFLRSEAENT